MLHGAGVEAGRVPKAPGVYVEGRKIAALGIRVRGGCCYHGIALNVDMDLAPYAGIHPCGFPGLDVTQLAALGLGLSVEDAARALVPFMAGNLGYTGYRRHGDERLDGVYASARITA
jgi:lipoyl(octanoyl) transferase